MKYGGIKLTKGVTRTVKIIGSAEKMKEVKMYTAFMD